MAVVTAQQYALENKLITKLDLMISRCTQRAPKKDALLLIEGAEGEGKTNSSLAIGNYVKSKTNRDIHLFFRVEQLINFAKNTYDKIIIWDEPSLDSLSTDAFNSVNKDLIRLLMTVRKRRHFFIFNLTKFYKFNEYIVVDRALGLIHMYSRKGINPGRFVYIRQRKLERLFNDYKQKKKRQYKLLASFRGAFPEVSEKYYNQFGVYINGVISTLEDYEKQKDLSISSIGEQEKANKDKWRLELKELKTRIRRLPFPLNDLRDLARGLNIEYNTVRQWGTFDDVGGEVINIGAPVGVEQNKGGEKPYNNNETII